jgi:hypothetical protein
MGLYETDHSGDPDCRDDTMKTMQLALSLGMDKRLLIETPHMAGQSPDLGSGRVTWRPTPDGPDRRAQPQLLPGRPRTPPRLGLELRKLPGV